MGSLEQMLPCFPFGNSESFPLKFGDLVYFNHPKRGQFYDYSLYASPRLVA